MFLLLLCFSCWMSVVHCKLLIVWNESYQWERYTGFSTCQRHNGHKWQSTEQGQLETVGCPKSNKLQCFWQFTEYKKSAADMLVRHITGDFQRFMPQRVGAYFFWCHTACQQLVMFDFFSVQSSSFWGINSKDDRSYMVSSYVFFF